MTANDSLMPAAVMAKDDWKSFSFIFAASFVVFLLIALVAQVCLQDWRAWLPGAEGNKSLIGGVKVAVYTFMSHLT